MMSNEAQQQETSNEAQQQETSNEAQQQATSNEAQSQNESNESNEANITNESTEANKPNENETQSTTVETDPSATPSSPIDDAIDEDKSKIPGAKYLGKGLKIAGAVPGAIDMFSDLSHRFLATYLPSTSSEDDLMGHMGTNALTGLSFSKQNQAGSIDFSIALPSGVMLGRNPIPLSDTWGVKGLNITLHLAHDSNVFFNTARTDVSTTTYKMSDLTLTAEIQLPGPDQLSRLMKQNADSFEYNSISSYYAVINNNHATINLNLGLKKVLSVFANFITASSINNYSKHSLETSHIRQQNDSNVDITEVVFTKAEHDFPWNTI